VGERDRPLGHGVDVELLRHPSQRVEEVGLEEPVAAGAGELGQVGQVLVREPELAKVVERVLEPARDREPPAERVLPEGEVEDRLAVGPSGAPRGARHGELVEVREQREGRPVQLGELPHGEPPA